VYDAALYDALLRRVIGFYYRDYQDHRDDFIPTFLANDILRFWRTLTLNYEHDRLKIRRMFGGDRDAAKVKSALKNYKLKSSRLSTCFSMVLHLASAPAPVTADRIFELCSLTPQERFAHLRGRSRAADGVLDAIDSAYERFLAEVQRPESDLLDAFGSPDFRRERLRPTSVSRRASWCSASCLAVGEARRRRWGCERGGPAR
jgi:hypothetical protein